MKNLKVKEAFKPIVKLQYIPSDRLTKEEIRQKRQFEKENKEVFKSESERERDDAFGSHSSLSSDRSIVPNNV